MRAFDFVLQDETHPFGGVGNQGPRFVVRFYEVIVEQLIEILEIAVASRLKVLARAKIVNDFSVGLIHGQGIELSQGTATAPHHEIGRLEGLLQGNPGMEGRLASSHGGLIDDIIVN